MPWTGCVFAERPVRLATLPPVTEGAEQGAGEREQEARLPLARALPFAGVALLLLALAELVREAWPVPAQTDDAYISYRYARNLLEGHGLVYNPGEYVEGMTNLLWTLLVGAGLWLHADARTVGHALGVASGAAVLLATFAYANTGLPRRQGWVGGVAAWVVLASLPFAYWTTSGMETPLFAALVTATLLAEARDRPGWAVTAALAASTTRPEGVLVAGLVFGWRVFARWRAEGAPVLLWPALYALGMLALTGFRILYYGSPVPNTFFAKVGGVPPLRGFYYAAGFWVAGPCLLLVPAVFLQTKERRWWPATGFAAVLTGYVVAVGGDAFPYARFFVPVIPPLAAMAARGALRASAGGPAAGALAWGCVAAVILVSELGRFGWEIGPCLVAVLALWATLSALERGRPRPVATALCTAALVFTLLGWMPTLAGTALEGKVKGLPGAETRSAALERNHRFNAGVEALAARRARVLAGRPGEVRLVATGGIGAFGYLARVPILDLYGLVDPEIARSRVERGTLAAPGHIRSNADYVFERAPDYLLIPKRGARMIRSPSLEDIWAHPQLDAHYEWDDEIVGYRRRAGD